jgi:sulfide:quinone oxidoreductase
MRFSRLTDNYAVAEQIQPADVAGIAAQGFVAVICNRPDNEEPGQPQVNEIAEACEEASIAFHHIPVTGMPIPAAVVQQHRDAIDASTGPVLGYCRSGQRSMVIWQAGL